MKRLLLALAALSVSVSTSACRTVGDELADGPQGSFVQGYDGDVRPPFRPSDGFAIQAPDGYVSLVFSDSDFNACTDGFGSGTSRVTFLLPPRAITTPGSHFVDVALDTVDSSCRNVRPESDTPAYGEITVDAIDSTGVRGSYKYAYRGSDVFGSFDVAF